MEQSDKFEDYKNQILNDIQEAGGASKFVKSIENCKSKYKLTSRGYCDQEGNKIQEKVY